MHDEIESRSVAPRLGHFKTEARSFVEKRRLRGFAVALAIAAPARFIPARCQFFQFFFHKLKTRKARISPRLGLFSFVILTMRNRLRAGDSRGRIYAFRGETRKAQHPFGRAACIAATLSFRAQHSDSRCESECVVEESLFGRIVAPPVRLVLVVTGTRSGQAWRLSSWRLSARETRPVTTRPARILTQTQKAQPAAAPLISLSIFRIANWTGSLDTFGNFISNLQSATWEKSGALGGLTRFLENVGEMAQSEKIPGMGSCLALSLLKRGIVGTWHRVSAKHLAAYLDEMTWRFNNRKNPFLFRDTMLRLIHSESLEYKELTKAA
jgi:hypothetical protein